MGDQLARLDTLAVAYAAHSPGSAEAEVLAQAHADLASEAAGLREGLAMGRWTAALLASPISANAVSVIETTLGTIEAFAPDETAASPAAGTPYRWNGTELSVGSADVAGAADAPVAVVQQRLVDLGFDVGPAGVDGVFGAYTREAVQAFQDSQLALLNAALAQLVGEPESTGAEIRALRDAFVREKARGVVGAVTGEAL